MNDESERQLRQKKFLNTNNTKAKNYKETTALQM
jgi:hypothetical protein